MPPPNPSVVEGQFDDLDEDPLSKEIQLVPSQPLVVKVVNGENDESSTGTESEEEDSYDEDDDDDDDMIEVRSKMKAMRAEGANEGTGKCRGGGSGGVSDGGKNLKFLNKIFVGEYQPNSAMASKVTNELNATGKGEKIKTKDKSHRATTEQVVLISNYVCICDNSTRQTPIQRMFLAI